MSVFITGAAGFIGYHLALRLLEDGQEVVGFDGLTPYYSPRLKLARLDRLRTYPGFRLVEGMLEDAAGLTRAVAEADANTVVHLAAQAGVRYSIDHPETYISSNLVGTANLLEALRANPPRHFLFASTSSVYGGNEKMPFAETDRADSPVSLYAATKKAGEAMTHSYAHLWGIPTTCFRFFTVFGPWGRPDMAPIRFAEAIMAGRPIDIYGEGRMQRDFTYVGDLVEAANRLIGQPPQKGAPVGEMDSLSHVAPWRVVNIASGRPEELLDFVATLEAALGRPALRNYLPMQPGDVVRTASDTALLTRLVGPLQKTSLADGIGAFAQWYRDVYAPQALGKD